MDKEKGKITVRSLGPSLDKEQKILWRRIEKDAFRDDPNYIPPIITSRKDYGVEREFFVLYRDEEPIGRATAVLDREWIVRKKENIGFLDGFCIEPRYKELASMLINKCLDTLREKKVEGVICTYRGFPGLAGEVFKEPPFGLPNNPPWYIDIFLASGFKKHKEWGNFRFRLPTGYPEVGIKRGQRLLKSLNAEFKLLDMRKKDNIRKFDRLVSDTFEEHFGFNPRRLPGGGADSRFKRVLARVVCRLAKIRIYVIRTKTGEILGFFMFHPDINIALRTISKSLKKGGFNPFRPLKLVISLRRAKRAHVNSVGISKSRQNRGIVPILLETGLNFIREDGYIEADTGPVLLENRPMVKIIEKLIFKKYGKIAQQKYDTLMYTFK